MARKLIGTAVTDENGEATITYTGTGAGEVNIVAESGTFQSETYELIDAEFYDEATDTTHKTASTSQSTGSYYYNATGMTVSYSSNGTSVVHSDNSTTARHFYYNDPAISTTKISGINTILNNHAIEFEITEINGEVTLYCTDGTNNRSINLTETGHYRIIFNGSVIIAYKDGVDMHLNNYTMTGANIRVSFMLNNYNERIRFRNFIIYPLI